MKDALKFFQKHRRLFDPIRPSMLARAEEQVKARNWWFAWSATFVDLVDGDSGRELRRRYTLAAEQVQPDKRVVEAMLALDELRARRVAPSAYNRRGWTRYQEPQAPQEDEE